MSEGKRVDEDWKRRAQAEKELDAVKVAAAPVLERLRVWTAGVGPPIV